MEVKAKVKSDYWIRFIVTTVILVAILILVFKDEPSTTWTNANRYLYSFVSVAWIFGGVLRFGYKEGAQLVVSDTSITFTNIWGKRFSYSYSEIKDIRTYTETSRRQFSSKTYQVIVIDFKDGHSTEVSANVYSNFGKMKSVIFQHIYNTRLARLQVNLN
ncbi:MAG: hypothetical protein ABIS36_10750 [Chryseolinea sp.]